MSNDRYLLFTIIDTSFLRFFGASLFGLVLDIALASVLHHGAGLPLIGAAALSLIAAAVLMYFVHESWTFRSGAATFSVARMGATVGSAFAALAVRSAALFTTSQLMGLDDRCAMLQIISATGLSFLVNYLLVQRIIGTRLAGDHK